MAKSVRAKSAGKNDANAQSGEAAAETASPVKPGVATKKSSAGTSRAKATPAAAKAEKAPAKTAKSSASAPKSSAKSTARKSAAATPASTDDTKKGQVSTPAPAQDVPRANLVADKKETTSARSRKSATPSAKATTSKSTSAKPASAPKRKAASAPKSAKPETVSANASAASESDTAKEALDDVQSSAPVKQKEPVSAVPAPTAARSVAAKKMPKPSTKKPATKPAAKSSAKSPKKAATKPLSQDTASHDQPVTADVIQSLVADDDAKQPAVTPTKAKNSESETQKPATAKAPAKSKAGKKVWLNSYPSVVPATIPGLPADSLGNMMINACRRYAGRTAFTCMGRDLRYSELEQASSNFAAYLQSLGLEKGARVALMMPNILQYPIALMATLRAGYTVVNVNPLYTARELEHQLKDSGAEAIVILENFAHTLESVVAKTPLRHIVVASLGDMLGLKGLAVNLVVRRVKKMVPAWTLKGHVRFNAALKTGQAAKFKPVDVSRSDLAFLQYTGGTTGISKGAMLSHGNILANIAQNAAWIETAFIKRQRPDRLVFVCALPLYHIYALTVNALTGMYQGSQNVLITNPRDIPAFVKELGKHKVNIFPGLNTLFNALLNNKEFQKLDFSNLALTFGGGMAVQQSVADRWKSVTGCIVSEGYGLSETSPVATANRFDADTFTGTIGLPISSTEIAIRDEDNNDVPIGESGEICIRGPQVMVGYWNQPEETARVMTADGYLKSGDIGFMDSAGYIKIVDRKKDMILVSGFNVYPNEVEEILSRHPKVLEAALVGVVDEKSGEAPKLFVVKKDQSLTEDELRDFCRENLTAYKRPRYFEFRSELPKSAVGKILRKDLRV